ncbi:hypothetical protein [Methylobacterium sp. Leaf108]|uniref:hypothetical protein n=1 Tax=Methylobacterium sp. Leaf108 TaxID=1736256 RepID=UPI0006FE9C66|nr:hypothetical protein [Methylobacterium sp. Leaf108]KQP54902.1 hypothetical protein ASF39_03865 [Methylobacterium sp. Leaf108]
MKQVMLATLGCLLSALSCFGADGYSFSTYLSDRGGCNAQRQILDGRLKELRLDVASSQKAGRSASVDLFGKPAADWSEADIREVLAAYGYCEEQLFLRNVEGTTHRKNRESMRRDYEVLIARGAARIEESLREIIAAGRSEATKTGAQATGQRRPNRDGPPGDRWNRDGVRPSAAAEGEPGERLPDPTTDLSEAERTRQSEIRAGLLQDARRTALERERDRLRAQIPPSDRPVPAGPIASAPEKTADAFAFAPRPIVDRTQCAVTREGFDQVQRGMPLERVEAVIGCRGTLTTTTMSADLGKVEVMLWDDRRSSGAITVQFLNNVVFAKSQVGLN